MASTDEHTICSNCSRFGTCHAYVLPAETGLRIAYELCGAETFYLIAVVKACRNFSRAEEKEEARLDD